MGPNLNLFIISNIVALACIIAAAFLAYHDISGWVWFLLVAVLTYSGPDCADSGPNQRPEAAPTASQPAATRSDGAAGQ